MRDDAEVADGPGRTWSLGREWSRAFTIMLALLLVAAVGTIAGLRGVVDDVSGPAHQLRRESVTLDALRTSLVGHEEIAHQLLSGQPVDRAAFVRQQTAIADAFVADAKIFPTTNGMRATIIEAGRSWQRGLTTYGLWGDQVAALHGDHAVDNPTFGASSDATVALLDGLEGPSLDTMDSGLAHGADLEYLLIAALAATFAIAAAVTMYFRRRMAKDLVAPVASMHQGVLRLRAGELEHRIRVARRDELGELAEAFNGMAGALHESHLVLTRRATHDVLTGLPNRAALTERLEASFRSGTDARQESVLFIDVDDFKDVNDALGHEGGDILLTELAARLNACVRVYDLVARLGGDEFAIVVVEDNGGPTAVEVAARIVESMRAPFFVGAARLDVSVSIGVAQRRRETADATELLRHADFAMYMAKGGGKGRYQVFDPQVHDGVVGREALKTDLAVAVSLRQLRLDYQPVVDLLSGAVVGVEALVRWQHPTLGYLPPSEFIPLAEETGDIDAIGCWVLATAVRQVAGWRRAMDHCADLWVSVNLSAFQLPNHHSMGVIQRILGDLGAGSQHVVLEVTETAVAADVDGGIASLHALRRFGVRIAIDDFGTGFSSLSTLASLPVDILKIDRSFVSGLAGKSPSVPMLEGILGLAAKLSLAVIAEGIETPAQLDLLRALGCTTGQGFLLARPAPAPAIEMLLASGNRLDVGVPAA